MPLKSIIKGAPGHMFSGICAGNSQSPHLMAISSPSASSSTYWRCCCCRCCCCCCCCDLTRTASPSSSAPTPQPPSPAASSQLASSGRPCTQSRRGSRSGWPASRSSWGWWWSARPASQHSWKNTNTMQTGVYYFALPIFCVWTCKTCFEHWASVFQPASRRTCSRRRWRRRPGRGLPGLTIAIGCQSVC